MTGKHSEPSSVPHTTDSLPSEPRTPSLTDVLANRYLQTSARLDPIMATGIGLDGDNGDLLTDFSGDGVDARADATRAALAALNDVSPGDRVDQVTIATMRASLRRQLDLDDAGETVGACNVIESPLQAIRDVFDLMPTATDADRDVFLRRLAAVPQALLSATDGLRRRLADGPPLARRQALLVAEQAESATDAILLNTASFADTRGTASAIDPDAIAATEEDLRAAFGGFADFLRTTVAPAGAEDDAVGTERYLRFLPSYLGADVDPIEAYKWGLAHLQSIVAEQQAIADELVPGGSVADALAHLNADPKYQIHDRHAFVDWMQQTSDTAVSGLSGTHFDVPDRLTRLECRLAPSATGIIYYTQPTADLSRPGRMWWAVPPGQNVFHTWQEKTTVYHEGIPGHHLQLGAAIVDPTLNDWRRLASFTSGHGEGWALYAERLMAELGWLDDLGDRMGMLDSQRLRAARVVVDIGVHCRLRAPASVGGGTWNAEKAWHFLTEAVAMDRTVLRFELNRYLGWAGQAPSYALGQRVWETTRTEALAAHPDWTLKDFHTRALALGGVSLDVLAAYL